MIRYKKEITIQFSDSLVYHIRLKTYLKDYLRRTGSVKHSDFIYPKCVEYVMGYTIGDGDIQYEKTPELESEFNKIDPDRLKELKSELSNKCKAVLNKAADTFDLVYFSVDVKDPSGEDINPSRFTWYLRWLNGLKKSDHRTVVKLMVPSHEGSNQKLLVFIGGNDRYKVDPNGSEDRGKMSGDFIMFNNPLTSIKVYGLSRGEKDVSRYGEVCYPLFSKTDKCKYYTFTENISSILHKIYDMEVDTDGVHKNFSIDLEEHDIYMDKYFKL